MRKLIVLAAGAMLLGSGFAATTAEARPGYGRHGGGYGGIYRPFAYGGGYQRRYGYGYGYRRRGRAGAAVAAGVAGALIGGAIAAQRPGYGYYGAPGYYGY